MTDDLPTILVAAAGAVAMLMVATWLLSLALRDASIVDIVWGLGFVVVGWAAFAVGGGDTGRGAFVAILASAWGLRLSTYLFLRNRGKGEDYRYRAMRRRHGSRFGVVSLVTVFGLQGVLMWAVSLPLQVAQAEGGPSGVTIVDMLGAAVWAVGLAFEALGDWQLSRFKKDSANAGKVMDRGLWRFTRHPNYFGDALVWWGLGITVLSRPELAWALVGPLIMTVLLTRVSGVPLLEQSLIRRREGYEDYIQRTSSFLPLPPKRR